MPQRGQNIRRSGRIRETRYTSFFMKQQVHMIALKQKEITPECTTCHGHGCDKYNRLCLDCDGDGIMSFNIALYEYVGMVEVAGQHLTRDGKHYSVRYFDLSHVPEMVRHEESRRRWDDVDSGRRPMSEAKWASKVPEDCLYSFFSTATDTAYEKNLDILSGFTKEDAITVMKLFDNADFDDPHDHEDVNQTRGPRGFGNELLLPYELMGEHPMLPFSEYNSSLNKHQRIVTESDYRKLHADVKIEPVLT